MRCSKKSDTLIIIIIISEFLHVHDMYMYTVCVCMYSVCITHNHKVIVEALISERIVNDVSESNSIVCCMRERERERACKGSPTLKIRNP